jgi:hypothetical protein
MLPFTRRYWIFLLILLSATPVLSQGANFGQFSLTSGFDRAKAVFGGYTSGSYSLSSIANVDRYSKPCIGYGAPNPDHIMVLENDFPQLILQVDSNGQDTTLVVRGPDRNTIRCNFGTNDNPDARIEDKNWQAGRYEIWVGSIKAGQHLNYRLSAQ